MQADHEEWNCNFMRLITIEWLKASSDDLLIIEKIIDIAHLSHMVAFHAQQSIEKSFKALIEEHQIEIPKIHKLVRLYHILENKVMKIDETILYRLDQLYIDSHYPGDMGLLPNGKPSLDDANQFYNIAKMVFSNICELLSINNDDLLN